MAPKTKANVCAQVEDVHKDPGSLLPTVLRRALCCNRFHVILRMCFVLCSVSPILLLINKM